MKTAKFCERNLKLLPALEAVDILRREHKDLVEIRIVDCFRRCLACRSAPFCRVQLTTIEALDAVSLVGKIIQHPY
ncbi:hypothetical protein [Paenibacillus sp. sgz302251]|uniref:hypothetical protein n=1 Tax=Paenibacillus sp. sgz302251 TaxID=3414493 RepID=UPI003C7CD422